MPHLVAVIAQVFNLEVNPRDSEVHSRLKRCITTIQVGQLPPFFGC